MSMVDHETRHRAVRDEGGDDRDEPGVTCFNVLTVFAEPISDGQN